MPAKRLSLADDFGLELELAPDYVLARVDDVPNQVAAENRRRGRRLGELLKQADALTSPPKRKQGAPAETDEQADERLAKVDGLYEQARDALLEVVISQTLVDGKPPELEELQRRLPTLSHAMWASNGLGHEANLDPTQPRETS